MMNQLPTDQQPVFYEDFEEVHLRDYLRILWIRRWLILVAFLVVLLAATYYVHTTDPVFESEVVLYFQKDNQSSYLLEVFGSPTEMLEVEAQKEFLTSPAVLNRVMDGLHLSSANFTTEELEKLDKSLDITSPRGSNLLKLKAQSSTPEKAQLLAQLAADAFIQENAQRKTSELTLAIQYLDAQISTVEQELQNIEEQLNQFRMEEGVFSANGSSETSSKVSYSLLAQLNELQREYTNAQMERALAESQLSTLQRQIDDMRAQIDPSDMVSAMSTSGLPPQIEEYQRKVVELTIQLDAMLDTYHEKHDTVIQARQQLEAAQARLQEELDKLMSTGDSPDPLNEWRALKAQKIAQEANVESLKRKEEFYREKIDAFNEQHPELVTKEVQLMRLERMGRQYEETYGFLLQKKKETELLKEMKGSDFDIYKPAELAEAPIKPRKRMTLALAAVLGLMLGVGSAFFLHYMDDSVHSPDQIERPLDLSVVGSIPKIVPSKQEQKAAQDGMARLRARHANDAKADGDGGRTRRAEHSRGYYKRLRELLCRTLNRVDSQSRLPEHYRILRSSIQFANVDALSQGEASPKIWMLTSSTPGEGKSLTASNLAMSFAEVESKVLLVDCDLRKPRIHYVFEQSRVPGIADYLVAQDVADELPPGIVRSVDYPNLHIVPSGGRTSNPTGLLGSPKMGELLKRWREEYDVVIVDSPPCLSVADTTVLARHVDGILLVVRAHQTKIPAVEQAKNTLQKSGTPIVGVVLNDVDYSRQYGAYYYYYQYYYRQYYAQYEDEEEAIG